MTRARDQFPPQRTWLEQAWDAVGDAAGTAVNGIASFGNALVNHPELVAGVVGGAALTAVSAVGEVAGIALDATGVGAIGGVPLGGVFTAGIATGAGIIGASMAGLAAEAAGNDAVEVVDTSDDEPQPLPAEPATKTDRLTEHLTERDLDAARRELAGEVVARKPNGESWDHVHEVRDAQNGLSKQIEQINRKLGVTHTTAEERAALENELSEASRMLDRSEQFVPRS